MGQTGSSNSKIKLHIETATKTGALVLADHKLKEVSSWKQINNFINMCIHRLLYYGLCIMHNRSQFGFKCKILSPLVLQ